MPGLEASEGAIPRVSFYNNEILSRISVDEDQRNVIGVGLHIRRERIRKMELRVAGNILDALLGSIQIRESRSATAPSRDKDALVTAHAGARVKAAGVRARIRSKHFQGVISPQGEDLALILQKRDGVPGNGLCGDVVISLHVYKRVHDTSGRESRTRVEKPFFFIRAAGEVGQGMILVLSELVPCSNDPSDLGYIST